MQLLGKIVEPSSLNEAGRITGTNRLYFVYSLLSCHLTYIDLSMQLAHTGDFRLVLHRRTLPERLEVQIMGYSLLTGSTGLVGRYLVKELLNNGLLLAVVVRSTKFESAAERFDGVMRHWESEAGHALPRPVILEGNLHSPGLGLSDKDRRWVAEHCDTVLHCAASMVFREDQKNEPFRTNVGGVENLLELCRETQIERFHHVSTAYICGLREGRVLESEVDEGQKLGNVYEESKLRAEKLVREADFLKQVTVYRPASVVGDIHTGYVTSAHGFYLPLQLAHIVADKIPVRHMNKRFISLLGLRGNEGKNLVPVDWLAKAIATIFANPALHGSTYHLASDKPVAVSAIQEVIQNAIELYHPRALLGEGDEDLSAYDELFREYMRVYQSHWRDDPQFDLTNVRKALPQLPCPKIDDEALMRIARYPIEKNFNLSPFKKVEPAFDVAGHLEKQVGTNGPPAATGAERVDVQVNGSGGGQWQVLVSGDQLCRIERGLSERQALKCYMTSETFRRLVERQLSVPQSIDAGKVLLEGNSDSQKGFPQMLEKLISSS